MQHEWTQRDAAAAKEFFLTYPGVKLLANIRHVADSAPQGDNIEKEAMQSQFARGIRSSLEWIENAMNFQATLNAETPDLDIELHNGSPDSRE